jgi:hypothetical protein
MNNVDLSLIKRLVQELETVLSEAQAVKADNVEYTIMLGKALGLASCISQEGIYLVSDISELSGNNKRIVFKTKDSLFDLFGTSTKKKIES